jgi:hypothetical protein
MSLDHSGHGSASFGILLEIGPPDLAMAAFPQTIMWQRRVKSWYWSDFDDHLAGKG